MAKRREAEPAGQESVPRAPEGEHRKLPRPVLDRLAAYYQIATHAGESGQDAIASATLAEFFGVDSAVVRKDMAAVGISGRPKVGYPIPQILSKLDTVLGLSGRNDAILIGCGSLGSAIARYGGFNRFGLRIVAVFDTDAQKVGRSIGHHTVLPMEKCRRTIEVFRPKIAIVAVPANAAVDIVQWLVGRGMKAIWNFAPIHLKVPSGISLRNEDLGLGLAKLIHDVNLKMRAGEEARLSG